MWKLTGVRLCREQVTQPLIERADCEKGDVRQILREVDLEASPEALWLKNAMQAPRPWLLLVFPWPGCLQMPECIGMG